MMNSSPNLSYAASTKRLLKARIRMTVVIETIWTIRASKSTPQMCHVLVG